MKSMIGFDDPNDKREILAHGWIKRTEEHPLEYIFQRVSVDKVIASFINGTPCVEGNLWPDTNVTIQIHEFDYTITHDPRYELFGWQVSEVKKGGYSPSIPERKFENVFDGTVSNVTSTAEKPKFRLGSLMKKLVQRIIR